MHWTFLFIFLAWLKITEAPPIDLPQSIYLEYCLPASSHANIALTSSCSLNPNVVCDPSLRPLPEKSKAQIWKEDLKY